MDKYELVLDIIEHPDNYSLQELDTMLADPETRDIYRILCKTDSALELHKEIDVEAEWTAFSKKRLFRRHRFMRRGSRAASIIAIVCTSIVAMAVGIAVTVSVTDKKTDSPSPEGAAVRPSASASGSPDTTMNIEATNIPYAESSQIIFEDMPFSTIMDTVADVYGVEVRFNNEEAATLHLYYKLDLTLNLKEVVDQLNTFESINITQDHDTLIID
ncbi:MAG: DUF4974 domain-containing protein [Muribaculaceae bacterium]|nr:DUF4974 domain-containing protein [Muribaculaceae bacterium]